MSLYFHMCKNSVRDLQERKMSISLLHKYSAVRLTVVCEVDAYQRKSDSRKKLTLKSKK